MGDESRFTDSPVVPAISITAVRGEAERLLPGSQEDWDTALVAEGGAFLFSLLFINPTVPFYS